MACFLWERFFAVGGFWVWSIATHFRRGLFGEKVCILQVELKEVVETAELWGLSLGGLCNPMVLFCNGFWYLFCRHVTFFSNPMAKGFIICMFCQVRETCGESNG